MQNVDVLFDRDCPFPAQIRWRSLQRRTNRVDMAGIPPVTSPPHENTLNGTSLGAMRDATCASERRATKEPISNGKQNLQLPLTYGVTLYATTRIVPWLLICCMISNLVFLLVFTVNVTPQNVIIAEKCNTNAKCNNNRRKM